MDTKNQQKFPYLKKHAAFLVLGENSYWFTNSDVVAHIELKRLYNRMNNNNNNKKNKKCENY